MARPPQGHPLVIVAGASDAGKELAAKAADVVFGGGSFEASQAFYRDVKGRLAKYGRKPDDLKVMNGITVVVGDNKADAERMLAAMQDRVHPAVSVADLGNDFGVDLMDLPLDQPIPRERVPKSTNRGKSFFEVIVKLIDQGLTLREVATRYNRGKGAFCGSAVEIADHMQKWLEAETCDGFLISFPILPDMLSKFVDQVVPELQRRGLFRTEYAGKTLRENLGLNRPANRNAR